MKSPLLVLTLLSLPILIFSRNCATCLKSEDKCDLQCACENDSSVCASSCCYNDVCSEAHECSDLLKPGFIALIVIACLVLIVILLCVFAACTGICGCILCCWREKFRERKYLPNKKLKTAIHDDLSMEALGHSEEEAFEDFPFKEEHAPLDFKLQKEFDFGEFERDQSNRSTNVTSTSHRESANLRYQ